ncbi:BTAD domain-containing putative transcriptional regulator [Plantactinospora sp. CA-290183]|uniref:AfsR/SARP family transcriptional regulator n=1 Tax=Plantactinospora sp. CA-290183 TaxID=3240006 RepID=UPI003D8A48D0
MFRLLGPVTFVQDGHTVDLGPAKQRAVLAALALEPNSLVSTERLIEMVWGDTAPAAARKAVQVYVSHLRRVLPAGHLVSRKPGYLLDVPPEAVDLHRFRALVAQARNVDVERARSLLASAEHLWRGDPFDGLGDVPALANLAAGLLEERLSVTEWRLGLEVEQGRAAEVIAQLRALVVAHPLREPLHVLLMLALLRTGRASEALAAYGDLRAVLAEELGIEPGPKAAALHLRILRSETRPPPAGPDPEPAEDAQPPDPVAAFDPPVAPAQLPYDVVDFVGRTDELAGAERMLRDGYEHVPIVVLVGQPGVGKTALAVRLGHRMRTDFPDGQLFADLGGARPVPADPAEIVAAMLRALGVPVPAPASLTERTAMLRSALAVRRVLMVLDDAADAAQVRPLLPGRAGSAVVVTSRRTLADLEGARIVRLDVLTDETSVELLRSLVGIERTAGELESVRRIAAMCGNLPLGLRIAGAGLASRPAWSPRHFADRLAHREALDELRVGDLGVRVTFELSFARPDAEHARVVRLLAVPDWVDFSPLCRPPRCWTGSQGRPRRCWRSCSTSTCCANQRLGRAATT